jgi:ankyrin repeat protein
VFQEVLGDGPDVAVVEQMIELGAPVHAKMQRGNALYHATEDRADPKVVKLLLEKGVPVGEFGHAGRTALTNAICVGNLETCKLLIDAGENLYAQPPHKKSMSEQIIEVELASKKPDTEFIKWQQSIVEHNREKPPAWYLDNVPKGKKIANAVKEYATKKGQKREDNQ